MSIQWNVSDLVSAVDNSMLLSRALYRYVALVAQYGGHGIPHRPGNAAGPVGPGYWIQVLPLRVPAVIPIIVRFVKDASVIRTERGSPVYGPDRQQILYYTDSKMLVPIVDLTEVYLNVELQDLRLQDSELREVVVSKFNAGANSRARALLDAEIQTLEDRLYTLRTQNHAN